uniref:Hydroxylysine kinase n=1 Tax=Ciona intestinalis TaxID=7719 RepID=F6W5B3_CIOIN|nr:hydroxylysine kinase isoform X1 [Ciona intestinalis]|eukprot:XP_002120512.1 hydroxylysine kinase isoform X1 [Ciona intestinalis]
MDVTSVQHVVRELYAVSTITVKQLEGYADSNYYISAQPNQYSCTEFVLKIIHMENESVKCQYHAIGCSLQHLHKQGVQVSKLIPTVDGEMLGSYDFNDNACACGVMLLTYIQGQTLCEVVVTQLHMNDIAQQSGKAIAQIDEALSTLHLSDELQLKGEWNLLNLDFVKSCSHYMRCNKTKDLCHRVFNLFEDKVVKNLNKLQTGLIHGDANDANLILKQQPGCGRWIIEGIIDFGDMAHSFYLFEIAILVAYFMMKAFKDGLDADIVADHVLKGFKSVLRLNPFEHEVLYVTVAEVAAHSLCKTAADAQKSPDNYDYIIQDYDAFEKLLSHICDTNITNRM